MSPALRKGVAVAAIHLAIVASVGAKLLVDRSTRPRVWARTAPYDPDLPLRGRYVRLQVEGEPAGLSEQDTVQPVEMTVRNGTLTLTPAAHDSGVRARLTQRDDRTVAVLVEPVAFFIPEHIPDPSVRAPGEELWVELTLPKQGPPRPIRLGARKNGVLTVLQ